MLTILCSPYCSQVHFAEGELGEVLADEELPVAMQIRHTRTFACKEEGEEVALISTAAAIAPTAADEQPAAEAEATSATAHTPGPKIGAAVSCTPLSVPPPMGTLPAKTPMNNAPPSSSMTHDITAPSPVETMAEAPPESPASEQKECDQTGVVNILMPKKKLKKAVQAAPSPTSAALAAPAVPAVQAKVNILQPKKKRRIAPTLIQ
jgi:hypothetical protein